MLPAKITKRVVVLFTALSVSWAVGTLGWSQENGPRPSGRSAVAKAERPGSRQGSLPPKTEDLSRLKEWFAGAGESGKIRLGELNLERFNNGSYWKGGQGGGVGRNGSPWENGRGGGGWSGVPRVVPCHQGCHQGVNW
jgi:hypothetical protein